MTITVKDTLKLESMVGAEVLAGQEGLTNNILYVNVMEVPDIIDWIEDYEMILTTAYPFKDNDQGLEQLVEELQTKNISALAIKPDRYITIIPEKVINMGNKWNIPIIKLPSSARFDLIINELMREIINEDYSIIKKSEEIHKKFTELVLAGGSLEEIANILSDITEYSVLITDRSDNEIARSANFIDTEDLMNIKEEKRPIYIYERVNAYIKILSLEQEFTAKNIMALERARDAAAIILLKKSGEESIERGYKNAFLNSVLNGEYKSKEALIARGKLYNVKLENSYQLFIFSINSFDKIFLENFKKAEIKIYNIITDIFNVLYNSFFSKSRNILIWSMNKEIYVLYPVKEDTQEMNKQMSKAIAKDIKQKLDRQFHENSISIGIGRFYPEILEINKSFKEAKEAIRIGKIVWGEDQIYHYDDVETYNMLMRSGTQDELEKYVEQKLGNLIAYDKHNNTDLVETLKVLLNYNGVLKDVAEEMFIHPKTVSYRRSRIEKILNTTLNNIDTKFELYMAIKLKELLYV